MKKTLLIIALALGATATCTAQIAADYLGEYQTSLDLESLKSAPADTAASGLTFSLTYTSTPSSDNASSQQTTQALAEEIVNQLAAKGFTLQSATASMQTTAYGNLTLKANALENANPLTKQTEVLYEWADSDVTPIEGGLRIRAANGATFTLESLTATTLRIPELHLILTAQNKQ